MVEGVDVWPAALEVRRRFPFALCGPCNQGKSNTRSEDYRPSTSWMAQTIAYTMRLAKFYQFDTDEILRLANAEFDAEPNLPRD